MKDYIKGYPNPKSGQYLVYVHTITYNQSKFIVDTLKGVAMQETTFPFVHAIFDDNSTDGEQEVIKAWLSENCKMDDAIYYDGDLSYTIVVPHVSNSNLTIAVYFLKKNLYKTPATKESLYKPWQSACKYEALCEGDDYWTDSHKLEKQVDCMENDPEVSITHSNYNFLYEESQVKKCQRLNLQGLSGEQIYDKLLDNNKYEILTNTVVFRLDTYRKIRAEDQFVFSGYFMMGDTQTWAYLVHYGKVVYFPEAMSVYRVLKDSACHQIDAKRNLHFQLSCQEMQLYMLRKFSKNTDLIERKKESHDRIWRMCKTFDSKTNTIFEPSIKEKIKYLLLNMPMFKQYHVEHITKYYLK